MENKEEGDSFIGEPTAVRAAEVPESYTLKARIIFMAYRYRLISICSGMAICSLLLSLVFGAISSSGFDEIEMDLTELEKEVTYNIRYFHTEEYIDRWERECEYKRKKGMLAQKFLDADCGGAYALTNSASHLEENRSKTWKVGLVGYYPANVLLMSGCAFGFTCPLHPRCEIVKVPALDRVQNIDVFLTLSSDYHLMNYIERPPESISVLYWREALWDDYPHVKRQLRDFDLEMGAHWFAGISNPNFKRPPEFLLKGAFLDAEKIHFAASVISDCSTSSERETYLNHLVSVLGPRRVHRFGKCGNRVFPGKPIARGMRILAQYKFYFSFENTIQTGYVSEKLLDIMMLSTVPVYYGDPLAPNITKTPSYIKASDFDSPRSLALYLLHLDENLEEYQRYQRWRKQGYDAFTDEYLDAVKHVAGPTERKLHKTEPMWLSYRRAMCCRLCDGDYLRERAAARGSQVVNFTLGKVEIHKTFHRGSQLAP